MTSLLDLVDARDFTELFNGELKWSRPDQKDLTVIVDDQTYTLTQVAGYKGLRIWHCPQLPSRPVQRDIDQQIAKTSHERLVIFTDDMQQEWRWPLRSQSGGASPKLLVHPHTAGEANQQLERRLEAIRIGLEDRPSLPELLGQMRAAFDIESEKASVEAARLMGALYNHLDSINLNEEHATLLLARLLFLLFGDDADLHGWRKNQFAQWVETATTTKNLHTELEALFKVLNTDPAKRRKNLPSQLDAFRYVNGGIFADAVQIPPLPAKFRTDLIDAGVFDWSIISPAIFGSMFQTVKSKEARRSFGEHYTTEANIMKLIGPLFLDQLTTAYDKAAAADSPKQLNDLRNRIGQMQFMDPACGCGNFLVVTYRELRRLEHRILLTLRDRKSNTQQTIFNAGDLLVSLDSFYGIEIEHWPAQIARTAMILIDHQMNLELQSTLGIAIDRLPLTTSAHIHHANALRTEWRDLMPAGLITYIFGNPPFIGHKNRQKEQATELKDLWGKWYTGKLDYVTGWHAKCLDYYEIDVAGEWGFVTTNSITQGEPVAPLFEPIFEAGWQIMFAHRTFAWTSEAANAAAVHCVIVGFTRNRRNLPRLFVYETPKGIPVEIPSSTINPYLYDGPNVLVWSRRKPLCDLLPVVQFGSMPNDEQHLLVSEEQKPTVDEDAVAAKYVRPFIGAKELLHNRRRWCLWLVDAPRSDLVSSPVLSSRLAKVKAYRESSARPTTKALATTPSLFGEIRQPEDAYVAIPRHASESRRYFTVERHPSTVICGDANFLTPDPDGFVFALLSSSMFLSWLRAVGGRIKSDPRFSSTIVWNNFPLPASSNNQRAAIITAGRRIADVRALHPERSLADHYAPFKMDPALVDAHEVLDATVDDVFGAKGRIWSEAERQTILFAKYAEFIAKS